MKKKLVHWETHPKNLSESATGKWYDTPQKKILYLRRADSIQVPEWPDYCGLFYERKWRSVFNSYMHSRSHSNWRFFTTIIGIYSWGKSNDGKISNLFQMFDKLFLSQAMIKYTPGMLILVFGIYFDFSFEKLFVSCLILYTRLWLSKKEKS